MSHPSSEKKDDPTSEMEESPSSETKAWFEHVRQNFNTEILGGIDSNVCVFEVPRVLSSAMPEAYTPQLIGLGPYHHLQPHLREMQRVKLEVAKKLYKEFHQLSVDTLANRLETKFTNMNLFLHARYHKFLNMDSKMLLWIMTVDALFLFYQLCQHGIDKKLLEDSPFLLALADGTGKKLADASIRRDIMMLENQIPIFFVRQMLTVAFETPQDPKTVDCETPRDQETVACETPQAPQTVACETPQAQQTVACETPQAPQTVACETPQAQQTVACETPQDQQKVELNDQQKKIVENIFPCMLIGFCKAMSPLKDTQKCSANDALESAHLLDLLYSMVLSREKEKQKESDIYTGYFRANNCNNKVDASNPQTSDDDRKVDNPRQDALGACGKIAGVAAASPVKGVKVGGQIWQELMKYYENYEKLSTNDADSFGNVEDPAEVKALIPTASSLREADVIFTNVKFIKELEFDPETRIFKIPTLKLGINSGVVIRNLVAYEAMAISGPLEFARFVEMMDGLINTVEDVKLLKDQGIITDRLKDVEVMHMFNGMSKCIEVNSDCAVDKVIEKVNDFYKAAPSVNRRSMLDRYVYNFWKALALASTVLLFLLMGLQTFCSAYNCASLVRK